MRFEPGLRPWPPLVIGLGLALAGILTVRRASLRLGRAVSVGAGALGMVAVVAVGVDQALAIPTVGLASGAEPDSPPLLAAGLVVAAALTAIPVAWAWRLLGPGQHPPRGVADTPRAG